ADRPARLGIARAGTALLRMRGLDRRPHQGGVEQRAAPDDEALGLELAVDLGEQRFGQSPRGQGAAEAAEGGLVRNRVAEAKAAEEPERGAIPQRLLKPRIREPVPLLQQQALEQA